MAHLPPPHSLNKDNSNDNNKGASSSLLSARQRLKQQRELEERRRFGLAPLAVDAEASALANQTIEISPNVPHTLSQAPWFYEVNGPTLTHQRLDPSKATVTNIIDDKVDRVVVLGKATRYVAGACQNCGSKTHKTKECFQVKKKVGSKYTGQVTGVDIQLETTEKTYSQKRDRFVGDVGVDMLKQDVSEDSGNLESSDSRASKNSLAMEDENESAKKKSKVEVFTAAAAQHGGVEIKALPKYLQNLDAMESGEVFFDPKTGSMRGNPNALPSSDHLTTEQGEGTEEVPTDISTRFQGDLARYRSGDYHLYLEHQHRFLTGATTSFVDFELDKAIGSLRNAQKRSQDDDEFISEKNEVDETENGSGGNRLIEKAADVEEVSPDLLAAAAMAMGVPLPPAPSPPSSSSSSSEVKGQRNLTSLVERLYKVKGASDTS